jgi:hypothetical protein
MNTPVFPRRAWTLFTVLGFILMTAISAPAQQWVTETRDPKQAQDEDFAKAYAQWTGEARFGSPLVDHLPKVPGIPSPKDILGYHMGAPRKLTYYADALKYFRALAAATAARQDRAHRQVRRGSRARRRLGLLGREHQEPSTESRQPGAHSPTRAV